MTRNIAASKDRTPTTTPKGVTRDHRDGLPASFVADLAPMCKGGKAKGADLARLMVAHDLLTDKGSDKANGLTLRTFMRSHGAWVGRGNTYGMTVGEARTIAAGYVAKVAPPKGVRYAKGQAITPKADAPKADA